MTITVLALLCCPNVSPPAASVSTEAIDAYADRVSKARKACGPTAVWYCLRRLGHETRLADLWEQAQVGPDGVSLQKLLDLLRSRGVSARALVGDRHRLEDVPVPAIVVVDQTHCVVYEGVEPGGQQVRFFEPASNQMRLVSRETFQRHWSGQVIVFEPPTLSPRAFTAVALLGMVGAVGLAFAGRWGLLLLRPGKANKGNAPHEPCPAQGASDESPATAPRIHPH